MSQKITVTKVEDHYEMQFDGGDAYPVPTNAIDKLDDALTPEDLGESVTFRGDYGGHKHAKTFDVGDVIETPGDDEEDGGDDAEADNGGDDPEADDGNDGSGGGDASMDGDASADGDDLLPEFEDMVEE